ncbi:MAG: hypothetical protein A2725_01300 [Candidatus Magasanikbacteria bacterium RIFCSPHIGHO2_01_FULL_33_34]|uniref:Uncharacterized protein n=1 Tax=Candidatus Magasanikbacteria bacterium RIFCSPHIGHO2_01_FULL_33_34 TaxID=1798671 RepID=A0A1F6LJC7_9BACT|nr:MAG: hypothetical protein A2725_01300 [Candidatus Magasanikbacteria bacterium RIFCSPHIGHO2_01_FULL_33_34]OGH81021.1 MAG: hypothetical protein A3F93_04550 [Candidatus Magasanikbacteria bacterium RIFCSPLOWO2_12_FULL_34_7]
MNHTASWVDASVCAHVAVWRRWTRISTRQGRVKGAVPVFIALHAGAIQALAFVRRTVGVPTALRFRLVAGALTGDAGVAVVADDQFVLAT